MTQTQIAELMSPSPHTIGQDQTLAAARRLMNKYNIRHLPVLEGGRLVGVLSKRDILYIDSLKGVDLETVPVSEAMTQDAFAVPPNTAVRRVVADMADHKYGSAVIVDGERVVGVFTTVDALRALSSLLGG